MQDKGFDPIYDDKQTNDTVVLKKICHNEDGSSYRYVDMFLDEENQLSEKNYSDSKDFMVGKIIEERKLYLSDGGQQKITCALVLNNDKVKSLSSVHISRRTAKGTYGTNEVVLSFESAYKLKCFLNQVFSMSNENPKYKIISTNELCKSDSDSSKIVEINLKDFEGLVSNNIEYIDNINKIVEVKKRKQTIIKLESIISGNFKNETEITRFLKQNLWLFGNEYAIFAGSGMINTKSILDIMPYNFENFVDIIEVKLPNEKLFNFDNSHNNYYCSSNLTKAIAQTQNYIFQLEQKTIEVENDKGYKVIRPKGIILFGAECDLSNNEENYLRILNSSYHNLQIVTYQQLLKKAKLLCGFAEENEE